MWPFGTRTRTCLQLFVKDTTWLFRWPIRVNRATPRHCWAKVKSHIWQPIRWRGTSSSHALRHRVLGHVNAHSLTVLVKWPAWKNLTWLAWWLARIRRYVRENSSWYINSVGIIAARGHRVQQSVGVSKYLFDWHVWRDVSGANSVQSRRLSK